ncbi:response regulator receiver [Oleiphilus messinensis]|uniref:Response regulator receiver n=1 Tax=Oleiphilus messinensis TaxID=141451 RepID=A0A1Y0I4X6_9GAMM|nr:response regulator [Oleiphilus messinensis]ARU55538.1 response regulator receiver [Oleiphilus messinensis]
MTNSELGKPLIMLVDDDPDDLYLVKTAFNQTEFQPRFMFVNSGESLMHYLGSIKPFSGAQIPSLILLDLNMPVMDGKKTLESLKHQEQYRSIPVIVYTTSTSKLDIEEAYRLGANSYVIKAGTLEEMVKTMDSIGNYWLRTVQLHDK